MLQALPWNTVALSFFLNSRSLLFVVGRIYIAKCRINFTGTCNLLDTSIFLFSFLLQELYSDVTLACNGKFFPVHKLVLSVCSEYFDDMFKQTNCKHPIIVLKDILHEDLEALLNYMYAGEANVAQSDLARLIKAAECLRIKGLAVPDEAPTSGDGKRPHTDSQKEESHHPKRRRHEDRSISPSKSSHCSVRERRISEDRDSCPETNDTDSVCSNQTSGQRGYSSQQQNSSSQQQQHNHTSSPSSNVDLDLGILHRDDTGGTQDLAEVSVFHCSFKTNSQFLKPVCLGRPVVCIHVQHCNLLLNSCPVYTVCLLIFYAIYTGIYYLLCLYLQVL